MSSVELAIRGGTVIDGTGRPGIRADVGIAEGRVVEIDTEVRGADEIDATGRLVLPGFLDIHTHYDPQVLWDPAVSPSSSQGVTSVVMGNCGFSIAPVRPEGRTALLQTLEKVEDMRLATLEAGVEWDFETYAEYLDTIDRRRPVINVGGYVGHTAVRVYVLGDEAADRPASEAEIAEMRRVVGESVLGGALGFSTDRAGFHIGAGGKPVPSAVATQDEVEALMRATADVGRGIVHIAPGDDYRWLFDFQPSLGRPINWSSILAYRPGSTTRTPYQTKLADEAAGRAAGADVWVQVTCRPIQQLVTLLDPAPLASVPAFGEVFSMPIERRHEPYRDPAWRARASQELAASSVPMRWDAYVVAETTRHTDLIGRSVQSIAEERGRQPLDVLCDLALEDDLTTRFAITFANDDEDALRELLTGEGCILGLSDAGAHVSQICDAVMPTDFLAHWVRDRELFSVEAGVRKLTGEIGDLLGIDRGYLRVGSPADVLVIDYEALDPGPVRRVQDMPAGGERLLADTPAGLDAIVVNGTPIRRDGMALLDRLERRPGEVLRSTG